MKLEKAELPQHSRRGKDPLWTNYAEQVKKFHDSDDDCIRVVNDEGINDVTLASRLRSTISHVCPGKLRVVTRQKQLYIVRV